MITNTVLRTTMLCCVLFATQASRNNGPRPGGYAVNGGAGGDWRADHVGQTGPDANNPNRGVGRPIADSNVLRRGVVMSGTNESWHAKGKMWGSVQILPQPLRTGETRPVFAWWHDPKCPNGGVHWLHPLLPGQEVEFVVEQGDKPHQVCARRVNRIGVSDLPAGTPQETVNMVAGQRHLARNVQAAFSPDLNRERLNALYFKIGAMTEKLFQERNLDARSRIDLIFKDKHKALMEQIAVQGMEDKEVEAALMQLVEELLRRNSQGNSPASSQVSGGSTSQPAPKATPKAASSEAWVPRNARDIANRARDAVAKAKAQEPAPVTEPRGREQQPRRAGVNFAGQVERITIHTNQSPGTSGQASPSGSHSPAPVAPGLSQMSHDEHMQNLQNLSRQVQQQADDSGSDGEPEQD